MSSKRKFPGDLIDAVLLGHGDTAAVDVSDAIISINDTFEHTNRYGGGREETITKQERRAGVSLQFHTVLDGVVPIDTKVSFSIAVTECDTIDGTYTSLDVADIFGDSLPADQIDSANNKILLSHTFDAAKAAGSRFRLQCELDLMRRNKPFLKLAVTPAVVDGAGDALVLAGGDGHVSVVACYDAEHKPTLNDAEADQALFTGY